MSGSVSTVFDLVVLWFLVEFVDGSIIPAMRRQGAKIKPMDKGSMLWIYLIVYPSMAIAFVLAIYDIGMLPWWTFYPGVAVMVSGVLIRQWAVLTLGRYFSETMGVQEGQQVVDHGPYRYVRHPAYTGVLVAFTGIGLALQSWSAVLLLLLAFAAGYGYRIRVEEKALALALGDEYVRYMGRTKRLIPFIL